MVCEQRALCNVELWNDYETQKFVANRLKLFARRALLLERKMPYGKLEVGRTADIVTAFQAIMMCNSIFRQHCNFNNY
jgi:hypothetical protein